jgi:molybdate transport repressor ModE-like protein
MLTDLWPGVDLRHLAAFEAVARERSFARAAKTLGYTQPAVSQQVAALEKLVGQRLVERSSGRAEATLTEAGELLLSHLDGLGARLAAARRELADFARGAAGTVRVGTFQTASARLVPAILRRFGEEHPGVEVELVEHLSDVSLLGDLERGSLDFAFCLVPVAGEEFETLLLVEDEYLLVTQEEPDVDSLDDLLELPLLIARSCHSAAMLDAALHAGARAPEVVFRSDDNAALREMARAGVGAAILPSLWLELGGNDDLVLTRLDGVLPPRAIGIAWLRDRELSAAQRQFLDLTREIYATTPESSGMMSSP